jgi:hypothetical protein
MRGVEQINLNIKFKIYKKFWKVCLEREIFEQCVSRFLKNRQHTFAKHVSVSDTSRRAGMSDRR